MGTFVVLTVGALIVAAAVIIVRDMWNDWWF